jgi:hypothetical protein
MPSGDATLIARTQLGGQAPQEVARLILAGSDFSRCFGFNQRRCFVQAENSLPSGQQKLEDFLRRSGNEGEKRLKMN